jgi:hypothetical protein
LRRRGGSKRDFTDHSKWLPIITDGCIYPFVNRQVKLLFVIFVSFVVQKTKAISELVWYANKTLKIHLPQKEQKKSKASFVTSSITFIAISTKKHGGFGKVQY